MQLLPRAQILITEGHFAPIINICAILFLIFIGISVLGRVFAKLATQRSLNVDDAVIVLAAILGCAQTSVTIVSTANGLGSVSTSSASATWRRERSFYASTLLLIPAVILSKCSVVLFIQSLVPLESHKRFGTLLQIFLALWLVTSEAAAGGICNPRLSSTTSNEICYKNEFWTSFNVISMVTDLVLIIWPAEVIRNLRASRGRRAFIIFCFLTRALAIAASIAQLIVQPSTTNTSSSSSSNVFIVWKVAVCMQIFQCFSISSACTPHLTTFFGSMVSGMWRVDKHRRQYGSNYSAGAVTSSSESHPPRKRPLLNFSDKSGRRPGIPLRALGSSRASKGAGAAPDANSTSSQTNIIKRTTSIEVINEQQQPPENLEAPSSSPVDDGMLRA